MQAHPAPPLTKVDAEEPLLLRVLTDKDTPGTRVDRAESSFREHRDSVLRYLLRRTRDRHEAEELTQRVFVDAAAALSDPECNPESMLAWLYAIADRRLVDELRRRERAGAYVRELIHRAPWHGDVEYDRELVSAIRSAVLDLPLDQRRVVVMKIFEGRSFAEIARMVGSTEAACKMRFSRGIRVVRASLDQQGHRP